MKYWIILIAGLLMISPLQAQEECGFDTYLEQLQESSEGQSILDEIREWVLNFQRNYPVNPDLHQSPVTIPVVIHVLESPGAPTLTDANIARQMEVLNQSFRLQNTSEVATIPNEFKVHAADQLVQFQLARRKPDGTATTGINRHTTSTSTFFFLTDANAPSETAKKTSAGGQDPWDPTRYLNIWVCNLKMNPSASNILFGYGIFPGWEDRYMPGVVMNFNAFGVDLAHLHSNKSKGRTLAHEVGHYLNLLHIFQDGCSNTNDEVADTPKQSPSYGGQSPTHPVASCGSNDMFMNYMSYAINENRRMFTAGQRDRILANFVPGGPRASLATSNALFPPNALTVSHGVYLEAAWRQFPAWKASMAMIANWAWNMSLDVDKVVQDNQRHCSANRFDGIPATLSDVICALLLTPQQVNVCYDIGSFYELIESRPLTILTVKNNEYYGLVVDGMVMDNSRQTALLSIKDPFQIGPRIGLNHRGAEYTVDYAEFMTNILEGFANTQTKVYFLFPPTQESVAGN
ncbi:M43 family zinc metalloprotease [Pontibacter sp. G13]|uniref:M43 family zinc metalloprotease n=1 Tax=Pontibacter sp. G13 TaxID=3074898 RepID=UPI00288B9D07|nr:M43 family zinc metalloprotease [Pontibacter sp. G13]WNJ19650.1 M43 family zinc metalloprotease [Pontibacter sp. G13]